MQDGPDEVQSISGQSGDDQVPEGSVLEKNLGGDHLLVDNLLDGLDGQNDSSSHHVSHQNGKENDQSQVELRRTTWRVTEGHDESGDDGKQINPEKDDGKVAARIVDVSKSSR
ncbi:hypothetical protein WICPIJ_009024 [Wickerhamomyces pijperi]|uniref:Uncharacterized protein n=1 Tax=Wickerhamomyces pijperi TaxID=599730 RepID=A0A9P8PT45_WICPI|nr:hypothetical protein WICPIJ_009024 [Wickerhamomyces pijperi]